MSQGKGAHAMPGDRGMPGNWDVPRKGVCAMPCAWDVPRKGARAMQVTGVFQGKVSMPCQETGLCREMRPAGYLCHELTPQRVPRLRQVPGLCQEMCCAGRLCPISRPNHAGNSRSAPSPHHAKHPDHPGCPAPLRAPPHLEQQVVLEDPLDGLEQVGTEGQRVPQPLLALAEEPRLRFAPHALSQRRHRAAGTERAQPPARPAARPRPPARAHLG